MMEILERLLVWYLRILFRCAFALYQTPQAAVCLAMLEEVE